MLSYQPYLLPPSGEAEGMSFGRLKTELQLLRNVGNAEYFIRRVNQLVSRIGERMTTQKKVKQQTNGLENFHFVNCSVGPDDWVLVEAEFGEAEGVFDSLSLLLAQGFKVSFSINHGNNLTIASLTDKRDMSVTYGACLTAGADGWYDALRVLLYKYHVVLKDDLAIDAESLRGNARIM